MKYQNYSTNKSKTERLYDLFLDNPKGIFTKFSISALFNSKHTDIINNASPLLTKLWRRRKIIRTKHQLSNGYCYSLKNKGKLEELYYHYLLPYNFADQELINLIELNNFESLKDHILFDFNKMTTSKFLTKYGQHYLIKNKLDVFLAKTVAFIMGDGHITKNKQHTYFYFKHLQDAKEFVNEFRLVFNQEKIKINKNSFCYEANINNKYFGKLLEELGAPIGNKVIQPFLIPNWIYNGPNNVKAAFLSVIYGNEGSKPQDNRWRIQFVISKNKKNVKNLLIFLNQIRAMLNHFGISTSFIQLRKQKARQFCGRYYIKGKGNLHKFYKLLEFSYASEKQKVLKSLILKENSFEV